MLNLIYKLVEWSTFKTLIFDKIGINFLSVEDVVNHEFNDDRKTSWQSLNNWSNLNDLEILKHLKKLHAFEGPLWVVTEASYKDNLGVFKIEDADMMDKFVEDHLEKFGECFFNGDVLILNFNKNLMWLFHHEGMFSLKILPNN